MKKLLLFIILILIFPIDSYAKQGCCSWHGGVSHCGDNGRYVCNDGTYSPSCTCTPSVSYKYGCTNSNALNYDASANRDDGSCIYKVYGCINSNALNYNALANTSDGSCQFEEEIITEEEIAYETIIEEGKENKVKQKGVNGRKRIITKNIKDETGNVISSEVSDEVILEPINEIIVEATEEALKEDEIVQKFEDENKKEVSENASASEGGIGSLLIVALMGFGTYKYIKKRT